MSVPAGMIDVVTLFMGDQVGILSAHQQESAPGMEPMYPWLNGPAGMMAEIKNASGWPADGYLFDVNYIYQTFTEVDADAADYNNPKSYKTFASASTPNGGIIWAPRYFAPGAPPFRAQTADSTYNTFLNGVAQPKATLGGPTEVEFSGPYVDPTPGFGGTLGQQPYYLQTYRYNPQFNAMEQNCYVPGYGRVRWQLFKMTASGIYALQQTSLYNSTVSGPCPKLAGP